MGGGGVGEDGPGGGGDGGGDRAGAGGSDDGGLGLAEEPLDGLAVGAVAELAGELEDAGGGERRHADPAAAAVDLGVAVLAANGRDGEAAGSAGGGAVGEGELGVRAHERGGGAEEGFGVCRGWGRKRRRRVLSPILFVYRRNKDGTEFWAGEDGGYAGELGFVFGHADPLCSLIFRFLGSCFAFELESHIIVLCFELES